MSPPRTKEERVEERKHLGRAGRQDLLQLLLAAWKQLDENDDATKGTNDGQD